jgi:hypothetical protein
MYENSACPVTLFADQPEKTKSGEKNLLCAQAKLVVCVSMSILLFSEHV